VSWRRLGRGEWAPLGVFLSVTFLWTWVVSFVAISAGEITTFTAFGGMWGPFVGVLVTRRLFPGERRHGSLAGLGWRWGQTRWQLLSFLLPVLYVGLAYLAVWGLGLAEVSDAPVADQAEMVVLWMAGAASVGAFLTFGEEVGWQGFLVPTVYRATGFTATSLIRGLLWSFGTTH
jgi:hypothetical protein